MSRVVVPAEVKANGDIHLPKPVTRALHLRGKRGLVGFVIDGKQVLLTRATVVPEPTLSDEEIALFAHLSKRGAGRKTFRSKEAALRYLWGL